MESNQKKYMESFQRIINKVAKITYNLPYFTPTEEGQYVKDKLPLNKIIKIKSVN